jgi:hypothetical protein
MSPASTIPMEIASFIRVKAVSRCERPTTGGMSARRSERYDEMARIAWDKGTCERDIAHISLQMLGNNSEKGISAGTSWRKNVM